VTRVPGAYDGASCSTVGTGLSSGAFAKVLLRSRGRNRALGLFWLVWIAVSIPVEGLTHARFARKQLPPVPVGSPGFAATMCLVAGVLIMYAALDLSWHEG
jgi:hypothetical protein